MSTNHLPSRFHSTSLKRSVTVMLSICFALGILLNGPQAAAQGVSAGAIGGGAIAGGLFGTYSALICHGKGKCDSKEAWTVLGIYTGAGIGTAILLTKSLPEARSSPEGFARVPTLVKPGDRISVRDASGSTFEGVVETVNDSLLRLNVAGQLRDFAGPDVSTISQRRHTVEGRIMLTGMILGLLGGAVLFPNTNAGWCSSKGAGACVIGTVALGGLAFGGLSAIPKRTDTIYVQPRNRTTSVDFHIAPVLTKDKRGVALSFAF